MKHHLDMKQKTKIKQRYHWLSEQVNKYKFEIGAEVGVATGITTCYLLKHCPDLQILYAVDSWSPEFTYQWYNTKRSMLDIFKSRKEYSDPRLVVCHGLSEHVVQAIPEVLDFVFIDASHDYENVYKDITLWSPKVRQGGLVCGHDIHLPDVKKAVDELFDRYEIFKDDNVWFKYII